MMVGFHDDVIKWKYFPHHWHFVPGIHGSSVNSPHKGQWRGALMFSLIFAWTNNWANNRDGGDLRRHCAHYDATVMLACFRNTLYRWILAKESLSQVDSNWCVHIFVITHPYHSGIAQSIIGLYQLYKWLDSTSYFIHDDVIKWKHFPRYWSFVRGIHRSPVNSPHKGQWRGALMFSLICAQINSWVNNGETGDLGRNRAHYDVTVMWHMVIYTWKPEQNGRNFGDCRFKWDFNLWLKFHRGCW